ncbi:MAG: glycosyltransferase family 9 protein [Bacteroidota bacterium]
MFTDKNKIQKILIIKLKGIGDVILSTVVFDNLKAYFPSAKIDFLTENPSKIALENIPLLNEILIYGKTAPGSGGFNIIRQVRRRRYDLVLDFYSNPRTAMITFLSGARYRAGFPYRGRAYAYNLPGPVERDKYHAAELHLEFLRHLGISTDSERLYFGLSEDDRTFADEFFRSKFSKEDIIAGISPSGGWPSKKCDPVKFAEIGDAIIERYSAKVLLLWGPGDQAEALEIRKLMKHKVTFAPLTDIRKMGALIQRCSFLVANDSGPMHISTAVGTPTLSLHGPTNPRLQGPFGKQHEWMRKEDLDCIGCNLLDCPRQHECFMQLDMDKVLEKIELLIRKNNILNTRNEKV